MSSNPASQQLQLQTALSATSFPSSAQTVPHHARVESPAMLPPSEPPLALPPPEPEGPPADSFQDQMAVARRPDTKEQQEAAFMGGFAPMDPAADRSLKEVVESITNGQMIMHKKVQYQAFSAAIDHQDHVRVVLEKLLQRQRFLNSKNKIVAYRVTQVDLNGQNVVVEGYDDDGEDGTGQKLLHLLEKMGVEDILVIVCIWHNGMPGSLRTDIFKYVLEAARNLLNALHSKVLEAAQLDQQKQLVQEYSPTPLAIQYDVSQQQPQVHQQSLVPSQVALPMNTCNLAADELIPSGISAQAHNLHKKAAKLYRPNHFKAEMPVSPSEDDKMPPLRITPVSQEDYVDAFQTAEQAIRALTKAHILELRSTVRPHPLVEKIMIQVCVIRGVIAPSLNAAKEMLGSMTFKMELMLLDVSKLKPRNVNRVKCTLQANPMLLPGEVSKYSEGAAILLTWLHNVIKWYMGYRYFLSQTLTRQPHNISKYGDLKQQSQDFLMNQGGRDSALGGTSIQGGPDHYSIMQAHYKDAPSPLPLPMIKKQTGSIGKAAVVGKKEGNFLRPKQLVFGDLEVLVPKVKKKTTYPIVDPLENFPDDLKREHLDEVEIPDIDNVTLERATLQKIMGNFITGEDGADLPPLNPKEVRREPTIPMPTNDEEMLIFMEKAQLDDQPTEFLIQLAERMKAKRLGMEKQEA